MPLMATRRRQPPQNYDWKQKTLLWTNDRIEAWQRRKDAYKASKSVVQQLEDDQARALSTLRKHQDGGGEISARKLERCSRRAQDFKTQLRYHYTLIAQFDDARRFLHSTCTKALAASAREDWHLLLGNNDTRRQVDAERTQTMAETRKTRAQVAATAIMERRDNQEDQVVKKTLLDLLTPTAPDTRIGTKEEDGEEEEEEEEEGEGEEENEQGKRGRERTSPQVG